MEGEVCASPHHDFNKNVAGAMEGWGLGGFGGRSSLPGTNSEFPRRAGLLGINTRLSGSG